MSKKINFVQKEAEFKAAQSLFERSQAFHDEEDKLTVELVKVEIAKYLELYDLAFNTSPGKFQYWWQLVSELENKILSSHQNAQALWGEACQLAEQYVEKYSSGGVTAPAPRSKPFNPKYGVYGLVVGVEGYVHPAPTHPEDQTILKIRGIVWETGEGYVEELFETPIYAVARVSCRLVPDNGQVALSWHIAGYNVTNSYDGRVTPAKYYVEFSADKTPISVGGRGLLPELQGVIIEGENDNYVTLFHHEDMSKWLRDDMTMWNKPVTVMF